MQAWLCLGRCQAWPKAGPAYSGPHLEAQRNSQSQLDFSLSLHLLLQELISERETQVSFGVGVGAPQGDLGRAGQLLLAFDRFVWLWGKERHVSLWGVCHACSECTDGAPPPPPQPTPSPLPSLTVRASA